jgi:hypothetical protein
MKRLISIFAAVVQVQGKGRYTSQALAEIYESGETGPLGYLAVARMLRILQPPLAQKFAARPNPTAVRIRPC